MYKAKETYKHPKPGEAQKALKRHEKTNKAQVGVGGRPREKQPQKTKGQCMKETSQERAQGGRE